MNEQKIDFIVASNQERVLSECLFYIDKLLVPEGYEIGFFSIHDGKSMTAAYNEGMTSSDAKYKVYLHQDVFILNRNFIADILDIFAQDSNIGMIGLIGGVNLPSNAVYWNAWNVGRTIADNVFLTFDINCNPLEKYMEVEAIDGMIMITQHDIKWREDLFTGWDYYDSSQSFEFRRKGFKVVVPRQETAWCLHDCGVSKLHNYDKVREIFIREYLSDEDQPEIYNMVKQPDVDKICEKIIDTISREGMDTVSTILKNVDKSFFCTTEIRLMYNIFDIYNIEKENYQNNDLFVRGYNNWADLKEFYLEVKYLLRRINEGYTDDEYVKVLLKMYRDKQISPVAVYYIARCSFIDGEKFVIDLNELCGSE